VLASILLVVSLGLDTLAVSIALGISGLPRPRWWRVGLVFSACEGGTPLIGLALGALVSARIAPLAGLAAGLLLVAIGIQRMVTARPHRHGETQRLRTASHGSPWRLWLLGLSVSIDNLAIGFTLGTMAGSATWVLMAIPLQTLAFTAIGLRLGARVGSRLGAFASFAAGAVLATLGALLAIGHWHVLRHAGAAPLTPAAAAPAAP
jgi:putative Mn2+ efflux pump MntP